MAVRLRVFGSCPSSSRINGRALFLTPDDWLERLTVATGADGVATLPYLPATVDPLRVRRDRPRHRPARLPASRSSRQRSVHPETRAAGAIGRFRLQRLGPAGGERPGRGLGGEHVLRARRIRTRSPKPRGLPSLDSLRFGADPHRGRWLVPDASSAHDRLVLPDRHPSRG